MWTFISIAAGGTLGCWSRYLMTNLVQTVYGRDFPYAAMTINLLGSFLMGFVFIETSLWFGSARSESSEFHCPSNCGMPLGPRLDDERSSDDHDHATDQDRGVQHGFHSG